jgi:arsenate reductase-like glutaredoxin family protein
VIESHAFRLNHIEDARKKKLLETDLSALLHTVQRVVVASGKGYTLFDDTENQREALLKKITGPSQSLRAPALIFNQTLVVGFHEDMYAKYIFHVQSP